MVACNHSKTQNVGEDSKRNSTGEILVLEMRNPGISDGDRGLLGLAIEINLVSFSLKCFNESPVTLPVTVTADSTAADRL